MSTISRGNWDKIFHCTSCAFCDKDKIFYGYANESKHKIAFIFQNPGQDNLNPENLERKVDYIKSLSTISEKTEFCRDDVLPWIIDHKYHIYFNGLFKLLKKHGFIQTEKDFYKNKDYLNNLSTSFLDDDVYFTDAVKCITSTKEIELYPNSVDICADNWLRYELNNLTNLKIIICFGNKADIAINQLYRNEIESLPGSTGVYYIKGKDCYYFKTPHPASVYHNFNENKNHSAKNTIHLIKQQQKGIKNLLEDIRKKIESIN